MKPKKTKIHQTTSNFPDLLRWIAQHHDRYTIERSNYSMKVETEDRIYLVSDSLTHVNCFKAYNMLKADIGNQEIPKVNRQEIAYYRFDKTTAPDAWCIDLNKAYPQALYNQGFISKKTFNYLTGKMIKKADRLKSMGMMASKKTIMEINRGNVEKVQVTENSLANFFYLACHITGDLMKQSARHEGFMFFWVDGLFTQADPEPIRRIFVETGYPAKIERVQNMKVLNNGTWLYYEKEGSKKIQPIPQKKIITDPEILQYIHAPNIV